MQTTHPSDVCCRKLWPAATVFLWEIEIAPGTLPEDSFITALSFTRFGTAAVCDIGSVWLMLIMRNVMSSADPGPCAVS